MSRTIVFLSLCIWATANFIRPVDCRAASADQVKQAIAKGVQFLRGNSASANEGEKTLIALAMMKGGAPATEPILQEVLKAILEKFENGEYKPGGEHLYEAGIEATLLADLDPEKYQPQIKILADYIVSSQQPNGGWDYPGGGHGPGSVGDTSLIQYCCLGLWAAERAAVEVDPKVWEGVLRWHASYPNADGGFAYCPTLKVGNGNGDSTLNMSVNAVGSIHIAMYHLQPTFAPLKQTLKKEPTEAPEEAKFGVLEQVKLDAKPVDSEANASIPANSVDTVRKAFNWVNSRFRVENTGTGSQMYYYYSLERMAALANVTEIGGQDWFNSCADFLISKQGTDGSWDLSSYYRSDVDTAFGVLFLTRSTGKLLKRVETPKFGDGLLAGGRGLPDDFANADFNGRSLTEKKPPTEPLDKLLASLSNTGGLEKLDMVQEQIVEQIQLGNREDLIGQVDQLVKLVDHPDPGIRQTAVWALGRTGNMNLAQHIIRRLSDENLGVMMEARESLCWISRRPLGFGLPADPLADLSANATDEQKAAAIAQWHKDLVLTWGDWYLKNRPFEDRGDAFEAELRRKMEKLKYGL